MENIDIIIQARNNSKRLPKKIHKDLNGLSLLETIVKRLKPANVNKIILATTNSNTDKKLNFFCKKHKIEFFSGKEQNVLDRFYRAAKKFQSSAIVRVCADNPFISSKEIDLLIKEYKKIKDNYGYYFNHRNYKNNFYADGFGAELIPFKLLEQIFIKAKSKDEKEHVTAYLWKNNLFKFYPAKTFIKKEFRCTSLDINTKEDYDFIFNFIKKFNIKTSTSSNKICKLYLNYRFDYYLNKLFNMNRSIAGNENRIMLKNIKYLSNINIKSFKSGQKFGNWKVPHEWSLKSASLRDNNKISLIDLNKNFLHVPSFSKSIDKKINFSDLKKKIFTHNLPNAIPYITFYYKDDWGICLSKNQLGEITKKLKNNKSKKVYVKIDTKHKKGKMNYGELLIKGRSNKEILISTYICHPNLANDNLSGVLLTAFLAKYISMKNDLKFSYRFLFIPETIGAIAYISRNTKKLKKVLGGVNISCVGGRENFSIKQSWNPDHFLNSIAIEVLKENKKKFKTYQYDIHGSDERQFSYHGLGINFVSIFNDKYYEFREYHNSLDNLKYVNGSQIQKTFSIYKSLFHKIEEQEIYESKFKYFEPKLSSYNLYPDIGGSLSSSKKSTSYLTNLLWILFLSNGNNTNIQIRDKLKINKKLFDKIIKKLKKNKLLINV